MRVIHTSDWHIGRRFKGIDLHEYQAQALTWLQEYIEEQQPDALLVSGDIYDLPRPSQQSVELFNKAFETLGTMECNGHPLELIFTPGNHDSAQRLGFGAALMRPNIHMRCSLADIAEPVTLGKGQPDETLVYTLPYLDPDASRPWLTEQTGHEIARTHEAVMKAALELVVQDLAERREEKPQLSAILMAHTFITGAEPSDSERAITVGGVDSVPTSLFSNSGLDYLALGHLHRAQRVTIPHLDLEETEFQLDRTPLAAYSGSLLAYSFSEAPLTHPEPGNGKTVTTLELQPNQPGQPSTIAEGTNIQDFETVAVQSQEPPFVVIRGTEEEILGPLAKEHKDDWVSITVQIDGEMPRHIYQRIDEAYTNALEKHLDFTKVHRQINRSMADLNTTKDEMEVMRAFVQYRLDRTPTEPEENILDKAVKTVRDRRAEFSSQPDQNPDQNPDETPDTTPEATPDAKEES